MSAGTRLVRPLLGDRVDIIGDVHGEADALVALLTRLGCDLARGTVERPIVFVGDLVDRGPDSVRVLEIAQRLVEAGNAQMILGNHELNLLLDDRKEGNGWYFGHDDRWWNKTEHVPFASRSATAAERTKIRAFLSTLPIALESLSLRVVHAAWEAGAIEHARRAASLHAFATPAALDLSDIDLTSAPTEEQICRPDLPVMFHAGLAEKYMREQNSEPVKVLTSGLERPRAAGTPLPYLSGKWRLLERSPWWQDDTDERAVVFGHYWRRRASSTGVPGKADPFEGIQATHWFGKHRQAFCIDYSVGLRFKPRHLGDDPMRDYSLGALRWPERLLYYDDAEPVAV